MMAGNPNWWSMHPPSLISPQSVLGSSSIPLNSHLTDNQEPPHQSWSQLLFAGLPGEEDRYSNLSHVQPKKLEDWDEQILTNPSLRAPHLVFDSLIKQEATQNGNLYDQNGHEEFQDSGSAAWSHVLPVSNSSPRFNCLTSLSSGTNNLLDFTYNKVDRGNQLQENTYECNSATSTGVCKKARVQPSPSQPPLKVRKEKLGDRITALHQLVSPFGKTDTASVLLEAIGYVRFLQGQIEALSSPYLGNATKNIRNQQSATVHGERNSVFPEDPGQLLNDTSSLKRKGSLNQDAQEKPKDLRSRGLCLVPVSCTQHVGSENGADYWAPAYGSGGF
ncbi:Transcription factor bHLH68 [Quillaja saponaria]|uniref:Transcription factor bHLH68 n=1 Tax=Quillaja saponaria TaxID=32244 RepID=A0AAD7L5D6_QUISA|nr:Transcription factor bHLH68 [Quillaja saponaria]